MSGSFRAHNFSTNNLHPISLLVMTEQEWANTGYILSYKRSTRDSSQRSIIAKSRESRVPCKNYQRDVDIENVQRKWTITVCFDHQDWCESEELCSHKLWKMCIWFEAWLSVDLSAGTSWYLFGQKGGGRADLARMGPPTKVTLSHRLGHIQIFVLPFDRNNRHVHQSINHHHYPIQNYSKWDLYARSSVNSHINSSQSSSQFLPHFISDLHEQLAWLIINSETVTMELVTISSRSQLLDKPAKAIWQSPTGPWSILSTVTSVHFVWKPFILKCFCTFRCKLECKNLAKLGVGQVEKTIFEWLVPIIWYICTESYLYWSSP